MCDPGNAHDFGQRFVIEVDRVTDTPAPDRDDVRYQAYIANIRIAGNKSGERDASAGYSNCFRSISDDRRRPEHLDVDVPAP